MKEAEDEGYTPCVRCTSLAVRATSRFCLVPLTSVDRLVDNDYIIRLQIHMDIDDGFKSYKRAHSRGLRLLTSQLHHNDSLWLGTWNSVQLRRHRRIPR